MIPNSNILLGHLPLMMHDDFRVSLYKFSQEYADEKGRCCFWMGSIPSLSVTLAADVQHVLKHSSHRRFFASLEKHMSAFLGKHNIGMMTGKEWKAKRAVIVKALHSAVQGESYGKLIMKTTQQLVDTLLLEQNDDRPREIGEIMKMLTLDCFGQAALHKDFGCCSALQLTQVAVSFEFLANEMMRRMTWGMLDPTSGFYNLPTPKNLQHAKHRKIVREYIGKIIQERQEMLRRNGDDIDKVPVDLLTGLIRANELSQGDAKQDLADEMLSDSVLSLLFAGYETSSVTLTYALYLISQYPKVEEKCLEEIQRVHPAPSADKYPYLEAVLTETLRLYPPAISTTRALEKELELDGITIPKDTYMYVPIWVVQRDPRNFDDPESFLPERWLASPPANKDAFVAFSAGAR